LILVRRLLEGDASQHIAYEDMEDHRKPRFYRKPDGGAVRSQSVSAFTPGRNSPCHCGCGKRYKRCCGAKGRKPESVRRNSRRLAGSTPTSHAALISVPEIDPTAPQRPCCVACIGICVDGARNCESIPLIVLKTQIQSSPQVPQHEGCMNPQMPQTAVITTAFVL
jgi:hypothetical protein